MPHIIPDEPSGLKNSILKSLLSEDESIISPSAPTVPSGAVKPSFLEQSSLTLPGSRYAGTSALRPSNTMKSLPAPEYFSSFTSIVPAPT